MRAHLFQFFYFLGYISSMIMDVTGSQYDVIDFIGTFLSAQHYEEVHICHELNVGLATRIVERVLLQHMVRVSRLPRNPKEGANILYLIKRAEKIHQINYLDSLLGNHSNQRIIVAPLQSHGASSSSEFKDDNNSLEISSTSHFFLIGGVNEVFHIIKLSKSARVIRLKASYDHTHGIKQKIMDLHGVHLKMVGASWFPHVGLKCRPNISLPCETYGMSMEISSIISNLLNLTIDVYEEKKGSSEGVFMGNLSMSGVMGHILKDDFDMGVPVYQMFLERFKYFDFMYSFTAQRGGFIFTENLRHDLLYSPFLIDSWLLILSITMISTTLTISLFTLMEHYSRSQSYSIFLLSNSLFFVVIYAYYGGALTMFLSSNPRTPFKSIKQVVLHPDWTLILRDGAKYAILRDLEDKNPEPAVIQYRKDVYAQPEKYTVSNVIDGLLKMKTERVVYYEDYSAIGEIIKSSQWNKNQYSGFSIIDTQSIRYNYIFRKKSVLSYIFAPVGIYVQEMGLIHKQKMDALRSLNTETTTEESSLIPLDLQQLKSIFYILCLGGFSSLVYYLVEIFLIKKKDDGMMREEQGFFKNIKRLKNEPKYLHSL